jgi:hypothetical protein
MQTEDFLINDGSEPKIIKDFSAILPRTCISVFSESFIVKSILLTNRSAFVISSQQCNMSWIFDLQCKQKLERLH